MKSLQYIFHHHNQANEVSMDRPWRRIYKDPYVDWLLMIIVSAILMILLIFMSLMVYVDSESLLLNDVTVESGRGRAVIDQQALADAVQDFEVRQRNRSAGQDGGFASDPSLPGSK